MNKKILIISRVFPPMGGGGVQRIVKFSVYLQELGWDVTVCTIEGENFSWIDEVRLAEIKNINVIRIKEKPFRKRVLDRVINKLSFYDYYNKWSDKVISHFKQNDKFNYDYVLTSGPPHSVHKIGLELKEKFDFFWVSDFRDHFTLEALFEPITAFHRKFLEKFEQNIYLKSDLVIAVSETYRQEVLKKFIFKKESSITTVYNGYDLSDLKLNGVVNHFDGKKINLLYLGGLRGDKIDGYFYKMLRMAIDKKQELFERVTINLIGDLSRKGAMIENLGLSDYFRLFNSVPYNEVGDYLSNSDGCLLWQNPTKGHRGALSGKFFDYFGMKKPIFSLGQSEGELYNIINGNKIGIHTDVNDIDNAANDFITFIENLNNYSENFKQLENNYYDSFNRKNQVNELSKLLQNMNLFVHK